MKKDNIIRKAGFKPAFFIRVSNLNQDLMLQQKE